MEQHVKVSLYRLVADPVSNTSVMVLKPETEDRLFPIWIGPNEANVISMEMENIISPRPMTHDLISEIICCFDGTVEKVVITDIDEDDTTFYAKLFLKKDDEIKIIDCRPSDAITIALKYDSNIFIEEKVFRSYTLSDQKTAFLNDEAKYDDWLIDVDQEVLLEE